LFQRQHEAGNFELKEGFPQKLLLSLDKVSDLRYGENPHQRAAFYRENSGFTTVLPDAVQLQGKELSFNNLLDLNAAFQLSAEFESPCAVIIKHTNPRGVAISNQSRRCLRQSKGMRSAFRLWLSAGVQPNCGQGNSPGDCTHVCRSSDRARLLFGSAQPAGVEEELAAFEVSGLGKATSPSRLQAG
jgi:hypothetical protein